MFLYLASKFLRVSDHDEGLGSAAGSAKYDRAKTQSASHHRFFHTDAFYLTEHEVECPAAGHASLNENAFVGHSHLGGVALGQPVKQGCRSAKKQEKRSDEDGNFATANADVCIPWIALAPEHQKKQRDARDFHRETEKRRSQEDNPMMTRLVEQRFSGHEIFFDVTQSRTSRRSSGGLNAAEMRFANDT